MRATAARRAGAVITTAVLTAAVAASGTPASALPAGQWWYGKLEIAKANAVSTGKGVTVAVLDTGVKASLPDLAGRVVAGASYQGGGDGRTDQPDGAAYFGHGTSMAGFIAGTGEGAGMRGVAPDSRILPVVVGSSDRIPDENVAKGIRYATDRGAAVINMSLGITGGCSSAVQQAVDYAVRKDVILVASSGNDGAGQVDSPASCVGVLAVGGLAKSAGLVPYSRSNYGPQVDFVAPAEGMTSLFLNNTLSASDAQGTSIASAIVAGSFALMRSKFPDDSARQIVTRALYNVSNKLGGKIFAKRIDDRLGFGEFLPRYGLTDAPPAGAKNPIYDEIEQHLRAAGPSSGTTVAPTTAPSTAPTSSSATGRQDTGGLSSSAKALLAAVVIVVVIGFVLLATRARRRPRGPVPPTS